MMTEALPNELLRSIKPQQVRSYALAKGWQRVSGVNGDIALFDHPAGKFDQLIVPMDDTFDDYAKRLRDIVETLSEFESRPTREVLNDLITPDSDIVRYRVASLATVKGSIPLIEGIGLLDGAKRSLLASACTVVNPVTHHPRMSRTEAQQLLSACHLGQTERRSFGISVSCPLRAVEQDQTLLPGVEPFTRRTVSTLMRSLSRIVKAIEADNVPHLYENEDDQPVLSANLCEAILHMKPEEENSFLSITASWATTLPAPNSLPNAVRIKHEYFPIIEDISQKLRPSQPPAASLFVGYVETLSGQPNEDGEMQGEAEVSVMYEDQLALVRIELVGSNWKTAHIALGERGIIRFKGVLHRGTRIHRITEITDLQRVQ